MKTSTEIAHRLLASNTQSILAECAQNGIRGVIDDCHRCIIARWLMAHGSARAEVNFQSIYVHGDRLEDFADMHVIQPVPKWIRDLMSRFDGGQIPDLVEPATVAEEELAHA